ncbi:tabersonine 16-hydroxylase 1-like [Coffea arabica]|uniref:Tabersonine 16-hydroxylase 1-like n=1 Tax=Coffea arabica TaxID=13443 RepID=A0A6P6U0S1_COFAR|nr:tabersonine 16-hydroxylase 2-like [Coffea arabica]
MELLSPKRVQTFKAIREDEVFSLIKSISSQKGSTINLSRSVASLSYSITSRAAFGKRNKDTERFKETQDELNKLSSEFSLADMFPSVKLLELMSVSRFRIEKVHRQINGILESIINEHKGKMQESAKQEGGEGKEDDLVDVLLKMQKRGDFEPQLTDTNVRAVILPRQTYQQCEINGYDIPAKADIIVNAWAIGRDPKYWIEAEKFNPSRFLDSEIDYRGNNFEYIPCGAGRRICPGISFSQAVIELALAQLLFHFDWKLLGEVKPEEFDMTENLGVTIRPRNDIQLIPIAYGGSCLIKG